MSVSLCKFCVTPIPDHWHINSYYAFQALYVSERIDAGTCFVNTYNKTDVAAPFGGFKMSGFGKDLGKEALNEYLKTKNITFEYN